MAVHTKLSKNNVLDIIDNYELGTLIKYTGIKEGIENTNYLIYTTKNKFVLTIFEERVNYSQIPFFLNLMKRTNEKGILCPLPLINKKGRMTNYFHKKKLAIFNFLKGKSKKNWSKNECFQVGKILANFHIANKFNPRKVKNDFGHLSLKRIFNKCKSQLNKVIPDSHKIINEEINYVISKWPSELPKGIIHADFFPDNVLFSKNRITGILDFYFSCYDFLSYDLAITINAWCFKNNKFSNDLSKNIIKGYESVRKLQKNEKKSLNILLRGASLRFLLTRIYDSIFVDENKFLKNKNPLEFLNILKFHIIASKQVDYFE